MNSQNILKFWGTKLDIKLDTSEFYDYEIAKTETDYNVEVLDFNTPISYPSLKIDSTGLMNKSCARSTISLVEVDNRSNDPSYPYSGFTWVLLNSQLTTQLNNFDTQLDNDIYVFKDINDDEHYFRIVGYNFALSNPYSLSVTGFTGEMEDCLIKLSDANACCPTDPILNAKPWAYQINHGGGTDNCSFKIDRRPEKGWTLDFVFNREDAPWSVGNTFYYIGTRGTTDIEQYADNNLSFSFTSDRRIVWRAIHYSGYCGDSGYTESYYTLSGQTPQLCVSGTSEDFEITITFDRYRHLTDCNVENDGGWNDLIPGIKPIPYTPESGSSVTSTQTTVYSTAEELGKKWALEKHRRLGVLKIYLNGRPVYKYENFEEVIPSDRGTQPFIQSWGRGTTGSGGIHNEGTSCFNMKRIKYFEEPLDFVHVKHHYLSVIKPNYNVIECVVDCPDDVTGIVIPPTPTSTPTLTPTPTPTITSGLTPTPTATPTSTPIVNGITITGSVSPGSIVITYNAQMDFPLDGDVSLYAQVSLQTISGDPITSIMDFIIPSGQTQAQHIDIIDDDYTRLSVDQYDHTTIVVTHTGSTPFTISPSLQMTYVPMDCYFNYSVTEFFANCDFEFTATEFFEHPLNDLLYNIIPDQDFTYVLIPNNDGTYTLIPDGNFLYQFIPNNDVTHITLPNNDLLYSLIPNNDGTYTLIPNNDIEYNVLKPGNSFYGEITLGEDSVEGTCNCPENECPRFYVTGDGPTFCESNIFVTNGDGFSLNGWGTIVYNGFYKTVNLDGTNVATYRTDCGTCPTTPTPTPTETPTPTPSTTPFALQKIVNLNTNDNSSYSGTGNSIIDLLGNTGAIVEGSFVVNDDGCVRSIPLNGTSSYVITSTSLASFYTSSPNPNNTSVFLWVYPTDNGVILSEQGTPLLNSNWYDSQIELVGGFLKFSVWPYSASLTSQSQISLNTWHNVGFTYSGTTLTGYLNGQSIGSITATREVPWSFGNGLHYSIGAGSGTNLGDGSYSALKFGQLEIWNGALSSTDISNNYNNSVGNWICSTPTPTPTVTSTSTLTPTPTLTSTPTETLTLYLNCYTVRQYLYGYGGGGASTLYILGTDYPNVGNIPVGATATINGSSVTITHNVFDDTSAYFQGGSGYRINVTPNVGNISAGTYIEFCWYSTTPPSTSTPTPTQTPTETPAPPTSTPTPTPTSTLPSLNFTISSNCSNNGTIVLSNFVGVTSGQYRYSTGVYTTENDALNSTGYNFISSGSSGIVTIGSSGTYWVMVADWNNPSYKIAKSVTISCTTPTPTPTASSKSWNITQCGDPCDTGVCACNNQSILTVYTLQSVSNLVATGTIVYTDPSLTTTWNGYYYNPDSDEVWKFVNGISSLQNSCAIGVDPCIV